MGMGAVIAWFIGFLFVGGLVGWAIGSCGDDTEGSTGAIIGEVISLVGFLVIFLPQLIK